MPDIKSKSKRKPKTHRLELTPKSIVLYGLCLLLLLGWIFVLGVMAGRGYLPERIKSLIGLETGASKGQNLVVSGDKMPDSDIIKTVKEDPKFAYYDELCTKKKEVAKRTRSDTEPKKERQIIPEKIKPIKNKGLYTLQVASLDNEINALKMVNRLKTGGFPAYYTKVNLKGKTRYRVRCGKFNNPNEAKDLKQTLAQREGILSSYIAKVEE